MDDPIFVFDRKNHIWVMTDHVEAKSILSSYEYTVYLKNEKLHREDGPAVTHPNGFEEWWLNGHLHREDGPAVTRADGTKEWWLNGKRYPFKKWIQINPINDGTKIFIILQYV